MRKLSFIIFVLILSSNLFAQSPHGGSLSIDCSDCHSAEQQSWEVNPSQIKFRHESTGFELVGEHQLLDCNSCHQSLVFSDAKPECSSCHNDVHENTVGLDCARCHSPNSWVVTDITNLHNNSRFPLLGSHTKADCQQCHNTPGSKVNFEPLGVECYDCHKQNYEAAKQPDHVAGNFSTDCSTCHSPDATDWSFSAVDHSFFPLVGGHAVNNCFSCHKDGQFEEVPKECFSCHAADYTATTSPNHAQLNFPTDCSQCHSLNPGWQPVDFNHDSFYRLVGAHNTIRNECSKCHTTSDFSNTPTDCYACHQTNYENTTNPSHIDANFPTDCKQCHNETAWQPATFNHDDIFPLTGAHDNIRNDCQKCHTTNDYSAAPTDCYGCHADNYNNTTNPSHTQLNFSTDCQTCHTTTAWQPAEFDHDGQFFPIYSGKHNGEWNACSDCHTDANNYAVFSCLTCHEHEQTKMNEEHSGVNGYVYESNACLSCHPTGGGEGDDGGDGAFNHANTAFPLVGAHIGNNCTDCHTTTFEGTSSECQSCHLSSYQNTTNPNHAALGFDQDCAICHSSDPNWVVIAFPVHDQYYQIQGAHTQISSECSKCHTTESYSDAPETCVGCHQTDYDNTSNPNHSTANFPNNCESCHTQNAWQPAEFDHDNQYFPIYSGKHNNEWNECADCHTNPNDFASFSCIDCHEHSQSKMDEEHQGVQGYVYNSNDCFSCHPSGSGDGAFNHATSDFPLTGAHLTTDCSTCHVNGYSNLSTNCVDCHRSNYDNTTNPNHANLNLSTDCSKCHTTEPGWSPADFPVHDQVFQLTGAHATIATECSKCHTTNTYADTPSECVGCHQTDYQNAVNPNHTSLNLPTDCAKCHTTDPGWSPAEFTIHDQFFQLVGAHAAIAIECSKCHTTGNYSDAPTECVGCHQSDYQNTTNPNHASANFPTTCGDCHSQNGWQPATFDHDNQFFPIYSGKHNGEWNNCVDCHTNSADYGVFSCLGCHEHNQTEMNSKHNGVPGYSYDSNACYTCHPTGSEDDGGDGDGDKIIKKIKIIK